MRYAPADRSPERVEKGALERLEDKFTSFITLRSFGPMFIEFLK